MPFILPKASYRMQFIRYSPSFIVGAAGFFTGLVYHKISKSRQFLISAADPVELEIDGIISRGVEGYVSKYAPMMKHGFPSYDTLRITENFVLSYDRRNRVPYWVMEHLTSDKLEKGETRGKQNRREFFEDGTIHSYFRATRDDYKYSGYDRGHMAAAANHKHCQRAYDNTFVLSNITPQNEFFNQGIWHSLERHVRDLVKKYGSIYVCSGPLYLPRKIHLEEDQLIFFPEGEKKKRKRKRYQTNSQPRTKKYVIYEVIGENEVAVPTHFFKIIVCEVDDNTYDMEAYIIPNQRVDTKTPLSNFMVPRDTIERAAGFLLFHQLPPSTFRYINGEESKVDLPMEF